MRRNLVSCRQPYNFVAIGWIVEDCVVGDNECLGSALDKGRESPLKIEIAAIVANFDVDDLALKRARRPDRLRRAIYPSRLYVVSGGGLMSYSSEGSPFRRSTRSPPSGRLLCRADSQGCKTL